MKIIFKIFLLNLFLTASIIAQDDEFGIASYYSDLFHGKPTASGELYDKGKMTAAHKTLPFGTMVKVTDLENNRTVQVRVNDRGPFISGRIIELSRSAANSIGLVDKGVSRVKVEILKSASEPVTDAGENRPETPTPAGQPEARIDPTPPAASIAPATEEEALPTAPATSTVDRPTTTARTVNSAAKENKKTSAPAPKTKEEAKPVSNSVLVKGQDYRTTGLYEVALSQVEAKGYGVQVASLTTQNALFKKLAELQGAWFKEIIVSVEQGTGNEMHYKIILGSYENKSEAAVYQDNLKSNKNIDGFVVDLSAPNAGSKSDANPASTVLLKGEEYEPIGLYKMVLKRPKAEGYAVQVV